MNCKKITLSVFLLGVLATIIVALPGCKDDETLTTERMVGKWNVTGMYEKLDGEWVSIFGADDAGWYNFRSDGTVSAYQRTDGKEQEAEMEWHVDDTTGEFYLVKDNKRSLPGTVVFENDDQFALHYTTILDSSGQPRPGEFKDILQRSKE